MTCIFCDTIFTKSSIEHIVPESLGNLHYVLQANIVCDSCNNNFSKWEDKAITRSHLAFIRIKNAIKTKKGNPSSLQIGTIKALGSNRFEKDLIKINGAEKEEIIIQDFDKSEMATSKVLLKIGFEALYKSNIKLFSHFNFTQLKKHLTKKDNKDWPFLTSHKQYYNFKSIPSFTDKYNLNKIKCKLMYDEISDKILLFSFKYDYWILTSNLLNRDYSWTTPYFENDLSASLYPIHFKKTAFQTIELLV